MATFRTNATSPAWAALQREILDLLDKTITPDDDWSRWPTALPVGGKAWLPVWTGLVCLADWIASDESFVESAPLHLLTEPTAYLQARADHAQLRNQCAGLFAEHAAAGRGRAAARTRAEGLPRLRHRERGRRHREERRV